MSEAKFKVKDRVLYIGGVERRVATVVMTNGATPTQAKFYDIEIQGQSEVFTVHENYLRPYMSDLAIAKEIERDFVRAQEGLSAARTALLRVRSNMERDGQPDYELRMLDEMEIMVKNTLRYELSTSISRWSDIAIDRKK